MGGNYHDYPRRVWWITVFFTITKCSYDILLLTRWNHGNTHTVDLNVLCHVRFEIIIIRYLSFWCAISLKIMWHIVNIKRERYKRLWRHIFLEFSSKFEYLRVLLKLLIKCAKTMSQVIIFLCIYYIHVQWSVMIRLSI